MSHKAAMPTTNDPIESYFSLGVSLGPHPSTLSTGRDTTDDFCALLELAMFSHFETPILLWWSILFGGSEVGHTTM